MNLSTYLRDIRYRMDDNPLQISPVLSDSILINMINNARRKISKELKCYENQFFIFPLLHSDEYPIPSDFVELNTILDVWKMQQYPPLHKGNAEITKTLLIQGEIAWYQNFFYINEKRKTITFKTLPQYLEPKYTILSFDRDNNQIVVNGTTALTGIGTLTSSGTTVTITNGYTTDLTVGATVTANGVSRTIASVINGTSFTISGTDPLWSSNTYTWNPFTTSNITGWNRVKGYVKIYDSTSGTIEYARVNEITDNANGTYILWIGAWDILNTYKNNSPLYGTVSITNNTSTVTGVGTKFLQDISLNDNVYYNTTKIGTINAITNDTSATVSANFVGGTLANVSVLIDNRYTYDNTDTVQFASFVCNYWSNASPLQMYLEEDRMPEDTHDLTAVLASHEGWMRRSRQDMANVANQDYENMKMKVKEALNEEAARIYNMGINT